MYRSVNSEKRHSEKVCDVIVAKSPARTAIAASWRRSMLHHGLTPDQTHTAAQLTAAELREVKQSLDLLMRVAKPVMQQLFRTVGLSGCCVILTDPNGVILHRLTNSGDDISFNDWGLRSGAVWSEANQGTNGIGTCAIEQKPVLIHKDQHFRSRDIGMTCMGAPIFDIKGKIMAVLDVSSARDDLGLEFAQVLASLVANTSNRIEADHFKASFSGAQIVIADGYCAVGTPLLASDRDDLVIGANRAARRMLSLQDETFANPIPRADLLAGVDRPAGLKDAERSAVRAAVARARGNMSAAARALGVSRATFYRLLKRHRLDGAGESRPR